MYVDCPAVSKNQITQLIGLTEKLKWSCDGQNNFDLIRGISVIIRTFKEDFERHGGNILPQKIRELTGQTLKNVSGFCLATGRFPKSDELKNKKQNRQFFRAKNNFIRHLSSAIFPATHARFSATILLICFLEPTLLQLIAPLSECHLSHKFAKHGSSYS